MAVDINALIAEWVAEDPEKHTFNSLADLPKMIATLQEDNYDFEKTFRGPKNTDCVGTKYSFGITSLTAFGVSESVFGQTATIAGLKGGFNAAKSLSCGFKEEAEAAGAGAAATKLATTGFRGFVNGMFIS